MALTTGNFLAVYCRNKRVYKLLFIVALLLSYLLQPSHAQVPAPTYQYAGPRTTRPQDTTHGRVELPIYQYPGPRIPPHVSRTQVQVLTHHNDNSRTGANLDETLLNTSNVTLYDFGKLFSRSVEGQIYAQPLYVSNVGIPGQGVHNVIYVATAHDMVYAYDADNPQLSKPLWVRSLGTPVPSSVINTTNIPIEVGIISTPVIAAGVNSATGTATGTLYVMAKTYENDVQIYRLHALDITTGNSVHGSPIKIAATVPGTGDGGDTLTFTAAQQLNRPALLLQNGTVYVAFGSHEDNPPYHGWVFGYNSLNLQAPPLVYTTTPNGGQGAIWQGGAGMAADAAGNLYCMVANGSADSKGSSAESGGDGYGEAFLKLTPGQGTLSVADWFMPHDADTLNTADMDVGSGGPLLLPGTNLVVGGGKSGGVYLINTAAMGHYHAGDDSQIVQSFQGSNGLIMGGLVYWNSPNNGPQIYVWGGYDFGTAYQFANGQFVTTPASQTVSVLRAGYSNSPAMSVSANGSQAGTGILWAAMPASGDANTVTVPGVLHAFDASNLKIELWNSNYNSKRDGGFDWAKFCPPTIANGKVYLATNSGQLNVYGLLPSTLSASRAISVHFGGTHMDPSEKAGVIPQPYWNTIEASLADALTNLIDSSGATTTATVSWSGNFAGTLPVVDMPGNFRMMRTYVDEFNTTLGAYSTVTVSGLPSTITAHGYDVYVYANSNNNGAMRTANYTLGGQTIQLTNDYYTGFDGIFFQANNSSGNYVVFPNLTSNSFTLTATPVSAYDFRSAPVNAIQIVTH